ncbi:DNA replication endonuclease-helicase Dna2 [Lecanora helva]
MAIRQKSFFDQNTKDRPFGRQHWNSKKGRQVGEEPPRPVHDRPPIAASSQSKRKLKAFEYQEKLSQYRWEEMDADKENVPLADGNNELHTDPSHPLSQKSASKDVRECPQTPLGRLPLSELLASGEDPRQHLNFTPMERVLWDNSSNNLASPQAGTTRKGRKRAHSSSPASSSQNEASKHFFKEKRAADTQALQAALKTPKADPVDDLWSRYSLNTNFIDRRSPTAQPGKEDSHLMHSSSPQTPASHIQKDSGGLRRALSCIEWPTSAAKRRKLFHGNSQKISAMTIDEVNKQQSRMRRVNMLVERIHDGLLKPGQPSHKDSSSESGNSSPMRRGDHPSLSPTEDGPLSHRASQPQVEDVTNVLSQTTVAPQSDVPKPPILSDEEIAQLNKVDSSDFEDDDLDISIVEDFDASVLNGSFNSRQGHQPGLDITNSTDVVASGPIAQVEEQEDNQYFDRSGNPGNAVAPFTAEAAPSTIKGASLKNDEFDDDESDVFAADLEDVCAKYDSQVQAPNPADDVTTAKRERVSENINDPKHLPLPTEIEVVSDNDEFGDDSDFEQIAAECAEGTQKQQVSQPQSSHNRKDHRIQRYVIKSVVHSTYEDNDGHAQPEKILAVKCERTKLSKVIALRQAWIQSPCTPESFLHLIGDFDRYGQCVVDNSQNLLILHPDHLISSTVVGDSFNCTRKAILQDRVKVTSDANQSTIYGNMLHEIFQEAMRANQWDNEFMTATIRALTTQHLETLFEVQVELEVAVEHLQARVADLQAWAEIFISTKPSPDAVVKERNGAQLLMSVNKLLEVEEKVWSPNYGLKGNVDATVQVLLRNGEDEKTLTVPFELKTGKHQSAAHKAQTSLYTLLLSDRYDVEIACGILYYMQTSEISSILTVRHELVPMIIQRNELASYVRNRIELPPMVKRPHLCGRCYAQTSCFIYHKMIDNGNGETSGMGEKFDDSVKHLNSQHQAFFRKWDDLLTKEEKDIVRFRRELWTMQSLERQKVGRCWGDLIIAPGSFVENQSAPKINRFQYTFVKRKPSPSFVFTESQIILGEPVVISDENGHYALANGFVTSIRRDKVQVTIDRRLHNARVQSKDFDANQHQSFIGIMEVIEDGKKQSTMTPTQPEEPVVYRIDKDEFSNGMAMVRNNVIRLMEKDVFGVRALRRLIVENVAPTFKPAASAYTLGDTASQADLNIDQKAAIEKVMGAKDYALVLGMPGTGKTTTIAHIIRALVAQGKSVLLTSYTHTAVDNILLKLRKDGIGIFRLGAAAKVHPDIQEFADLAGEPVHSVDDLKRRYTQPIVATTCLGINHPIFNQRIFDYCIVDEASQITLPVCLGPIRMARTFILVGDHYQLPPLVSNKEAIDGGLDVSLFKTLSDNHPESVTNLEHQYRMCENIMTLSNTLIYNGRLKCGTPAVAGRSIKVPAINRLEMHHYNPQSIPVTDLPFICGNPFKFSCWLRQLIHPSTRACFVNTDRLLPRSREVLENGSRITNPIEATLTTQLVESLLTVGIPANDIGVITLYRSQLALIKQHLRHRPGIEMHTADKFQGRDKEVVILSFVHSNEGQVVGELLKDWRRINVALTRARTKLLILGSRSTLIGNELLKDLITLMESRRWWFDLHPTACEGHVWEDSGTQVSGKGSVEVVKVEVEKISPVRVATKRKFGEGKENQMGGRRVAAKQGKLDMNALLRRRPVLKDIVNDLV